MRRSRVSFRRRSISLRCSSVRTISFMAYAWAIHYILLVVLLNVAYYARRFSFSELPVDNFSLSDLFLDTKRLQQFNDFLVAFAVKEVLVGTGQSVPGALQRPFLLCAATNKNQNQPLLPMHDRGGQRRRTVVLFTAFNVGSVVQKPLKPFRFVMVNAIVKRRRDAIHGLDRCGIRRDDS